MSKVLITVKDEVWATISGLPPHVLSKIIAKYSLYVDGYLWMPKYKSRQWDGKIKFIESTGKTYVRLLDMIINDLVELGWHDIELVDNRKVLPNKVKTIDAHLFGDVEIGGKPFVIRPYQVECVNEIIENSGGIVLAGTGAGKCLDADTKIVFHAESIQKRALVCKIGDLFDVITEIEGHLFEDNQEYYQRTPLFVPSPDGYCEVVAMIRKVSDCVKIKFTDNSELTCADMHILYSNDAQVYAKDLICGTTVDCYSAYSYSKTVASVTKLFDRTVYDVMVSNPEHRYCTYDGIIHHNTTITAALSHRYSTSGYPCITIVPSDDLVSQTYEWYDMLGMDTGLYSGSNKDIDHLNVVATWQAVQYNPGVLANFPAIIWDEAHGVKAQVAGKLLNESAKNSPFKVGVTGTLPPHATDRMSIKAALGDVRKEVPAKWLMDHGYLSKLEIQPVELNETWLETVDAHGKKSVEEFPDYAAEKAFVSKSPSRMDKIADIIVACASQHGNTLILVNSIQFGQKLSQLIPGSVFLYGNSPKDLRKEHYAMFEERDDLIVIASSGIASTGISIDRVFCLILVDAGKSFIRNIQSIGRGLRRGRDKDFVMVYDVFSKLKHSQKHWKDRSKYYTQASYPVLKKQIVKVVQKGK